MTVKELMEYLSSQSPNRLVVMSTDGEGNSFSPLSSISEGLYMPENRHSGSIGQIEDGDLEDGSADHPNNVLAIVLWPIG